MTSKEKLLQLRHDFYSNDSLNYDSISYFTSIEKDLEILEILKKHEPSFWWIKILTKVEEYNQKYIDIPALKKRILTEEEFKKLKEWLK